MNPHEKAIKLIISCEERIEQACNQSSRESHYKAAKKCAKIAAQEAYDYFLYNTKDDKGEKYYLDVLNEIDKL